MKRTSTSLLLMFAVFAAAATAQDKTKDKKDDKKASPAGTAAKTGNDRVTRVGKPVVKGTIVSESCVEVVVKKDNGLDEKIPAIEVVTVDRADAPESFRRGVGAVASGDAANGAQLLKLALEQAKDRPWLAEAANFYLGEASMALGKFDEAVVAYDAVVAAKADSRLLGPARMGAARAHSAGGRAGDAEKVLTAFVQEAEAKKVPRRTVLLAREMQGINLEAQNRFGEASGVYDAVVREAQAVLKDDPAVAERIRGAQRSKASCLIKEKKFDDAGRVLDALANEKSSEGETLVLSGRGELAYAQGKFDEARFFLARALGAKFQADRELPRAKLLMAKALIELDKAGDKTAAKTAQFYLNDLVQRDAASEAAKEARTLLKSPR